MLLDKVKVIINLFGLSHAIERVGKKRWKSLDSVNKVSKLVGRGW